VCFHTLPPAEPPTDVSPHGDHRNQRKEHIPLPRWRGQSHALPTPRCVWLAAGAIELRAETGASPPRPVWPDSSASCMSHYDSSALFPQDSVPSWTDCSGSRQRPFNRLGCFAPPNGKSPAWSRAELSEVRVGVMGQLHLPRRLASILPSHSVCVSAAPIRGYPGDCGDPHLDWEVFAGVPKILVKGVSIVGVTKQHNAR